MPSFIDLTCTDCERDFAGYDAARRHIVGTKCLTDRQLHERGIEEVDGVWRRVQRQGRLAGVAPRGRPPKPLAPDHAAATERGEHKKADGVPR